MQPICFNPYMNTVAQVVEIVHSVYDSLRLHRRAPGRRDRGRAAGQADPVLERGGLPVEVPRGILFHEYAYDKSGMCLGGNCIIPTNQNHANIQSDFEKLVPELLAADKTEKEIALGLEMLVRAYDPCISCSTHYLDVTFVR